MPCRLGALGRPACRAAAALLATLLLAAVPMQRAGAQAVDGWLVLVVDRSGSIDDDELRLQRNAYIEILRDPEMAQAFAGIRVAIVEFDSTAEVVVGWSGAAEAAARYAAHAPLAPRGGTAIGRGLEAALGLLQDREGERIIDISGDGRDNRDPLLLEEVRAEALREGIEINGLVFEGRANARVTDYFRDMVVSGFTVSIADLDDFADALRRKLRQELNLSSREAPR